MHIENKQMQQHSMQIESKSYTPTLISYKADLSQVKISKRHKGTLYVSKRHSLPTKYNNAKYLCTKYWHIQYQKANTTQFEGRGRF